MAHKTGAIGPKDLERVVVDTTVQPKAVAHPTDARLLHRATMKLVGFAKHTRVPLRQSYLRRARAATMTGRYTHAHQFKRARRQLQFLRTRLAGSSATPAARLMARPVARFSAAGAQPGSASARSEGLCVTCSGG